jgi:hypothetical protein
MIFFELRRWMYPWGVLWIVFVCAVWVNEVCAQVGGGGETKKSTPWRAHEALGTSDFFMFMVEHRARFEHLENDYRAKPAPDSTGLFLRTLLFTAFRWRAFEVGAEVQDARAYVTDQAPLNATHVNSFELLRAYVGLRFKSVFEVGDGLAILAGRLTLDVGSRRLAARNDFRNTVNGFTGIDAQWTGATEHVLRVFAVMPVVREPSQVDAISENQVAFDRENPDALFWGLLYALPMFTKAKFEVYVLGLHERDGEVAASAERQLWTPGVRLWQPIAVGSVDFQVEVMGQFGRSRSSAAASDVETLNHVAFSAHVACGYVWDVMLSPRVAFLYDYASGDGSPGDHQNNRFDPLFGARRFDWGPTGMYGALGRANVSSPGIRVDLAPYRTVDFFGVYRAVWLASARDAWTTAGLRDTLGDSGIFVGHQVEGRVRWHVWPQNISLDVGGVYLMRGAFAEAVVGGDLSPTVYFYAQITGTI